MNALTQPAPGAEQVAPSSKHGGVSADGPPLFLTAGVLVVVLVLVAVVARRRRLVSAHTDPSVRLDRSTMYRQRIGGWDAVAGLVGLGLMLLVQQALVGLSELRVVWIGAPVAAVLVRRRFLPQLDPPATERPPSTPMRRALGYALMIGGGVVLLIDGTVVWMLMTGSELEPVSAAIGLAIFTVAAWVASAGFRRVA